MSLKVYDSSKKTFSNTKLNRMIKKIAYAFLTEKYPFSKEELSLPFYLSAFKFDKELEYLYNKIINENDTYYIREIIFDFKADMVSKLISKINSAKGISTYGYSCVVKNIDTNICYVEMRNVGDTISVKYIDLGDDSVETITINKSDSDEVLEEKIFKVAKILSLYNMLSFEHDLSLSEYEIAGALTTLSKIYYSRLGKIPYFLLTSKGSVRWIRMDNKDYIATLEQIITNDTFAILSYLSYVSRLFYGSLEEQYRNPEVRAFYDTIFKAMIFKRYDDFIELFNYFDFTQLSFADILNIFREHAEIFKIYKKLAIDLSKSDSLFKGMLADFYNFIADNTFPYGIITKDLEAQMFEKLKKYLTFEVKIKNVYYIVDEHRKFSSINDVIKELNFWYEYLRGEMLTINIIVVDENDNEIKIPIYLYKRVGDLSTDYTIITKRFYEKLLRLYDQVIKNSRSAKFILTTPNRSNAYGLIIFKGDTEIFNKPLYLVFHENFIYNPRFIVREWIKKYATTSK